MNKNRFLQSSLLIKVTTVFLIVSFLISPLSVVFAKDSSASTGNSSTSVTTPTKNTPTTDSKKSLSTNSTKATPPTKGVKLKSLQISAVVPETTQPYNRSSVGQTLQPKTDLNTGALTFEYPIKIPAGRNGQTPDIKLQYNSKNNYNDSPFGYGWTVNIPYIERINKDGTDKLYTENSFYSSADGELV